MKVNFLVNGAIKLVLSAETDIELAMLKELYKQPTDAQIIDSIQIADKVLPNSVIITGRKAEEV